MADMREIRAGMGVPPFRPQANGHGGDFEEDELVRAMRQRRALLGTRLLDDTTSQVQAQAQLDARKLQLEARELELKEAEADARLHTIRAELAASRRADQGGGGHDVLGAVVQLLMEDRQAQREAADKGQATQMQLWREMFDIVRSPQAKAESAAPLPTLADRIQELKAVLGMVREFQPGGPQPAGPLTASEIISVERAKAELAQAQSRLALETQLQLRRLDGAEARAQAEHALRAEAIGAEKRRNDQLAGLLEQAAPAAMAAIAAALSGQPVNGQQAQQPGTVITCPNGECGKQFLMPAGASSGVCPHCRQMVMMQPDAEQGGGPG